VSIPIRSLEKLLKAEDGRLSVGILSPSLVSSLHEDLKPG